MGLKKIKLPITIMLNKVMAKVAKSYVAGENIEDVVKTVERLKAKNILVTIGYFDSNDNDNAESVFNANLDIIKSITNDQNYVSVKVPSLDFNSTKVQNIFSNAFAKKIRIHFDSLWPESVEPTQKLIESCLADPKFNQPALMSFTLPASWKRSEKDVDWVCKNQIPVRIVKGQWVDPEDPDRDLTKAYYNLVEKLAGRAFKVGVATHDPILAEKCIQTLKAKNTACELELLYGLPMRDSIKMAKKLNVPIRIYIPYGQGYLPYAAQKAIKKPKMLYWIIKDYFKSFLPSVT